MSRWAAPGEGTAAYLDAGSAPRSAVRAAYDALRAETDRLFRTLFAPGAPGAPGGVQVAFSQCPEPYRDDDELIAAVRATRVLEVTTAAIHAGRLHPMLGCEPGGPFDRFRAVHDLVGHAATGFGFALTDEVAAWRAQDRLHGRLARHALASELLGVNCARALRREAPEQAAVLLEPRLVDRARASGGPGVDRPLR